MVKKGGNANGRGKYNQRGRMNGGGMNDFRNRSQMSNGKRPMNGGFGDGQRSMSRFSSAPNGNASYQSRPYNGGAGNSLQANKPAFVPRSTTSNYPQKPYFGATNGSATQTANDQSKFNGLQSKPQSLISNVNQYGQMAHQSYPQVMASGIPSMYNLPPPSLPFSAVPSVSYSYPPPILPVKN